MLTRRWRDTHKVETRRTKYSTTTLTCLCPLSTRTWPTHFFIIIIWVAALCRVPCRRSSFVTFCLSVVQDPNAQRPSGTHLVGLFRGKEKRAEILEETKPIIDNLAKSNGYLVLQIPTQDGATQAVKIKIDFRVCGDMKVIKNMHLLRGGLLCFCSVPFSFFFFALSRN